MQPAQIAQQRGLGRGLKVQHRSAGANLACEARGPQCNHVAIRGRVQRSRPDVAAQLAQRGPPGVRGRQCKRFSIEAHDPRQNMRQHCPR
jgi:hypothetical protein